ncbi:WavE lipopolysaccharide synthesis [Vibrio ichthyoenteri ATCC 700023]|uniref:WavE lipopolysaccharide synthesis n=1 Tax=Vibrio ichthyoenteri ATCC 700023 TaxID=870968 RepID=F9S4M0_9VIBR|nr:WavE lipopolysaccharide synthesis family protein [Vibrio ichthyoenteri]EGU36710.1 WavE lipopolysaccharide synthesis [Vibrio ichthyoenteri ATCC 700023]
MTIKINSSDISVVVQGQLFKAEESSTLDVIRSIRQFYPDAEVILSTWINADIGEELNALCDHIVLTDDPGDMTVGSTPININRQLVSTKRGLEVATRPFVIKTRTDLRFTSSSLLEFMALNLDRTPAYSVGKGHVCVADFSTRTHLAEWKVPFWVCDFIYAGHREDILKIFAVDLYPKELFEYYLNHPKPAYMLKQNDCFRYTPESYITYRYLSLGRNIPFENSFDNNPDAISMYEELLVNNLIVLGAKQLGVESLKYYLPLISTRKRLTYPKWQSIYKKYHQYPLPKANWIEDSLDYLNYKLNKITKKKFK